MTGLSLKPLQQALYATLTGDSTLMAMITGVFDYVPDTTSFPYVMFGGVSAENADALGRRQMRLKMEIAVYSRSGGKKQAMEILERLHVLLHNTVPTLTGGQQLMFLGVSDRRIVQESDGLTWRGILTLDGMIQE